MRLHVASLLFVVSGGALIRYNAPITVRLLLSGGCIVERGVVLSKQNEGFNLNVISWTYRWSFTQKDPNVGAAASVILINGLFVDAVT